MWFNKGDQNSLESGLKRPRGNELCRRLHPNDSRNPFSFTVAPQGVMVWGRGTASAVDRVLSLMAHLRRSSPLFFIPLEPYPARSARHLPHAGKALFRKYRYPHPTSAPSGHLLPGEGGRMPFPMAKRFPRIVISSEREKSFSFAARQRM